MLRAGLAFPNYHHSPTQTRQSLNGSCITKPIFLELILPELDVTARLRCSSAILVLMPKAAMNKKCNLVTGKHEVGRARQTIGMKAKPKLERVSCLPNSDFRFGVSRPDFRHHQRANGLRRLGHDLSPCGVRAWQNELALPAPKATANLLHKDDSVGSRDRIPVPASSARPATSASVCGAAVFFAAASMVSAGLFGSVLLRSTMMLPLPPLPSVAGCDSFSRTGPGRATPPPPLQGKPGHTS